MQPIETLIKQQLNVNKSKNLLFENIKQIMDIEPGFLAGLEKLLNSNTGGKSQSVHPEIHSFTAKELVKRLYAINPYLQINRQQVEKLETIYRQTWQMMKKTGNIKTTLKEFHYPELSRWLAWLYPEKFRNFLKEPIEIGQVTYGEYSAELQVELLGIDITHIKQPVIDIGCGSHANLVMFLCSLGIEAYGIDRYLEVNEQYLEQVDWFEYYFKPNWWGTIIANMSFTNHVNYAYRHDISQVEQYLLKTKEIIESLSIGGRFYYAPSIPFIEKKLSIIEYKVEREQKVNDIFGSIVIRMA